MLCNIMFKKITCYCIALLMAFAVLIPEQVQAKEKEKEFSPDTVITKDNIYDVLEYLGIDSNNFIETDETGKSVRTVGELEKTFKEVTNKLKDIPTQGKEVSEAKNDFIISPYSYGGTKMLYKTMDHGGSYTITYSVAGEYSYRDDHTGYWSGVGSADASVDSDAIGVVYKITSKDLDASYTANYINLDAAITVTWYIGVDDVGLIPVGSNDITADINWDTSYIPSY